MNCFTCGKPLPENKKYCNEECLRKAVHYRRMMHVQENSCKICHRPIPKDLTYCSKVCLDIDMIRKEEVFPVPVAFYHEVATPFTEYANAKAEQPSEFVTVKDTYDLIIEVNANIANQYIEQVMLSYQQHPKGRKLSFEEWMKCHS